MTGMDNLGDIRGSAALEEVPDWVAQRTEGDENEANIITDLCMRLPAPYVALVAAQRWHSLAVPGKIPECHTGCTYFDHETYIHRF